MENCKYLHILHIYHIRDFKQDRSIKVIDHCIQRLLNTFLKTLHTILFYSIPFFKYILKTL